MKIKSLQKYLFKKKVLKSGEQHAFSTEIKQNSFAGSKRSVIHQSFCKTIRFYRLKRPKKVVKSDFKGSQKDILNANKEFQGVLKGQCLSLKACLCFFNQIYLLWFLLKDRLTKKHKHQNFGKCKIMCNEHSSN